jgi:hypothetical protein
MSEKSKKIAVLQYRTVKNARCGFDRQPGARLPEYGSRHFAKCLNNPTAYVTMPAGVVMQALITAERYSSSCGLLYAPDSAVSAGAGNVP